MAQALTISNTFGNQAGSVPASELDTDFSQLSTATSSINRDANYYVDSSGTANSILVTIATGVGFTYAAGVWLDVQVANTTTSGSVVINVNGLGAVTVVSQTGAALSAGQIVAAGIYHMLYDGTNFRAFIPVASSLTAPVSIAASTGVSTLFVYGPPSTDVEGWHAIDVQASTTSGQSLGLRVRGGTTSADHSLVAQNAAGTISMFEVFGDTSYGFFRAAFTPSLYGTANGNVQISAPVSGVALSVAGLAGSYSQQITGASTSGQSFGLQILAGTTSADYPIAIANQANTVTWFLLAGDSSWGFFRGFAEPTLSTTASGNVTVAAPSAGVALGVTGLANSYAQTVTGSSTSGESLGLKILAGTNSSDYPLAISVQANTITSFLMAGDTSWGFFRGVAVPTLNASAAGNVAVSAPSSGVALAVTGLANSYAQTITGSSTSSESLGLKILAGTNSSDYPLAIVVQGNTITSFLMAGDTSWGFFRGFSTPTLNASAAGNVAVSAPASGVAFAVTGLANSYSQTITGSGTTGESLGLHIMAGTNSSDFPISISNQANSVTWFLMAGDSSWGFFRAFATQTIGANAAGNVTIAAPSSGQTLTVAPSPNAGELIASSAALTSGAGSSTGTLTNAPAAGNPTKWIKINDSGTIRSFPAW